MIAENVRRGQAAEASLPWLAKFAQQATGRPVAAALDYTRQYRDVPLPKIRLPRHCSWRATNRELFHAGVWLKNFLFSSLGTRHNATAINLIVDNDAVDSPAIRVPAGSRTAPRIDSIAFDAASDEIPYEERGVLDESFLDSFDARVAEAVRPWLADPLVLELWEHLREAHAWTSNLGQLIAGARHKFEGAWGLNTLEVPLSIVAAQPSFRGFAVSRLWDAERFGSIYNAALHDYRVANHIRSRSHPVPDLVVDGEWQETPFWIWSRDAAAPPAVVRPACSARSGTHRPRRHVHCLSSR